MNPSANPTTDHDLSDSDISKQTPTQLDYQVGESSVNIDVSQGMIKPKVDQEFRHQKHIVVHKQSREHTIQNKLSPETLHHASQQINQNYESSI